MDLILAVIAVICIIIIVWLHNSPMPSTFYNSMYPNELIQNNITQLDILRKLDSDNWKLIINPEERDSQDQILLLYPHAHIEYYFIKSNPLLITDYDINSPIWVSPSGTQYVGYKTLLDIENLLYP